MAAAAPARTTSSRLAAETTPARMSGSLRSCRRRIRRSARARRAGADQQWGEPESGKVTVYAELVLQLLAALPKEFSIDRDRIYLTGQSRGGLGTWDLITKRPGAFAGGGAVWCA